MLKLDVKCRLADTNRLICILCSTTNTCYTYRDLEVTPILV